MISKNNITRCVKSIEQLIRRCESYGEFDEQDNLILFMEKTETSHIKISKETLKEYESSGMSIVDLHKALESQADSCTWTDISLDIQVSRPKLRTKIF
jgi:hypothetical protein